MSSPEQIVRDFCDDVHRRDPERLRSYLADDVVYHNIPLAPAEGIGATMEVLQSFLARFDEVAFEMHHLGSDGPTVLTERTDHFTKGGVTKSLPVMGAFHVVGAKITAWRDYFDMAQVSAILSGE